MPYFRENPDFSGWNLFTESVFGSVVTVRRVLTGSQFQHGPASAIGPPYVYSYYKDDSDSLRSALEQAVATPIGR